MSEPIITGDNVCSSVPLDSNLAFQKHWFCAAICKDGEVVLRDCDSPSEFLEILNNSILAWVDYRTADFARDIRKGCHELGFTDLLISSLLDNPRLLFEDYNEEMGIKLPSIQIRMDGQVDVQFYPTVLLLRRNFILTVHPLLVDRRFTRLRRYSDTILKKIPVTASAEDKLTLLLIRIIDQNNDRNFEHLRQIEERGDDLNKGLLDPNVPRTTLGPQIYAMKHALITYLDALWETQDVLHDLRYGDANLLTNETRLLEKIEYLSSDVSRQIGLAEHMS
ncbi:MAG: magnesium transporter CorA, partial [Dehalococcoidia bacterium]|nr:magnesium transporter CorA [Dehalococcoidia bacterium]